MSTAPDRLKMALRDYVTWEQTQERRHMFYRGELFAMAGGTIRHNIITGNIYGRLHQLLAGRDCRPFGSDQRIRINGDDLSTYPDVSVVCGGIESDPVDRHAIVNPRVIFEVLSKSTENFDRGKKFESYQHLESLREYVVVYQNDARIIHYAREDDGTWRYRLLAGANERLILSSIGTQLSFEAIYREVQFGPELDDV